MGQPERKSMVWSILVHSSPPGCSLSLANLLYRENFLQSVLSKRGLVSDRAVSFGWLLRGVRVWKLSRTYQVRNYLHSLFPTQRCCFTTRNPTRHLLAIPNIPVGMVVLYMGQMASSVLPSQEVQRHLFKDF